MVTEADVGRILKTLNSYVGLLLWTDVITKLPEYDEDATNKLSYVSGFVTHGGATFVQRIHSDGRWFVT